MNYWLQYSHTYLLNTGYTLPLKT